jgi:hypothetical protein
VSQALTNNGSGTATDGSRTTPYIPSTSCRRNHTVKLWCLEYMLWFLHQGKPYPTQKEVLLYVCVTRYYRSVFVMYLHCVCVCILSIYGDHMCDTVPRLSMACFSDHESTGLFSIVLTVGFVQGRSVRQPVFQPLFSMPCTSCSKRYWVWAGHYAVLDRVCTTLAILLTELSCVPLGNGFISFTYDLYNG